MDYTSPWASSPDANRTSFSNDAVPSAELPGPAVREDGKADGGQEEQGYPTPSSYSVPGQGSWSPEQQHQWQQQQQQAQHQHGDAAAQRASGEEPRRPQSARYHGVPPQQRQHVPQYKLQAKITGLERGGKKDPILKFDVYVCVMYIEVWLCGDFADGRTDESPKVQDDTIS